MPLNKETKEIITCVGLLVELANRYTTRGSVKYTWGYSSSFESQKSVEYNSIAIDTRSTLILGDSISKDPMHGLNRTV